MFVFVGKNIQLKLNNYEKRNKIKRVGSKSKI